MHFAWQRKFGGSSHSTGSVATAPLAVSDVGEPCGEHLIRGLYVGD
jgi:hypothetical protein